MWMKLPEDVTAFCYGGTEYLPDADGVVEIPATAAAEAARHGLVETGAPKPPKLDKFTELPERPKATTPGNKKGK